MIVQQDKTMNSPLSGFSQPLRPVSFKPYWRLKLMFVFDRSALAVLLPLALLVAVVTFSGRSSSPAPVPLVASEEAPSGAAKPGQAVAANLPSR
jgi:hypothetical protein